jgi:hypothetical protein
LFRAPAGKDQVLHGQLDLEHHFVVGYITNVRPLEGIATMFEAFREFKIGSARLYSCFWGNGKCPPQLRKRSRRLGVDESVRFVGRVPHPKVRQ